MPPFLKVGVILAILRTSGKIQMKGLCISTYTIRTSCTLLSSESTKLRDLRAKDVQTCQRALHAYVLMCQRAFRAYVPTRQRALHA